jgi:tetratricopeptide (TPR) repeat protein
MHRVAYIVCLVTAAVGCKPVPQVSASERSAPSDSRKIPITTQSDAARELWLRGRVLNENLQPHEAHALFQQAADLDPSFALAEYSLAATAITARELETHLSRAIKLAANASVGERLLILGLQARTNGDPDRARQLAESLVVHYPQDERAHWTLASACSAQQQYERTISELRKAIALNPRFSLAFNQLGYAYRSAGQLAEAEKTFLQYIALVPGDPNPYDSYAELLMKVGRFDESIGQYRKALAIDPHFTGSFVGIATDEALAGRYDAAVAEAERYFSVARDDRERRAALLALALVHVDHGANEQALSVMERRYALARAIGDTVNMSADGVQIADILLELGRVPGASERFTQAHALLAASGVSAEAKQDDALASTYDAARVALAMGDLQSARASAAAYSAGAALRKNDARIRQSHELNGLVALAAKDFDVGIAEFALADQQNPAVIAAKGRAYAGRGDIEYAHKAAEQARNMNVLLTFPYAFTRAALAASTASATSGSAGGTRC